MAIYKFKNSDSFAVQHLCNAHDYSFRAPLRKGELVKIKDDHFLYVDKVKRLVYVLDRNGQGMPTSYSRLVTILTEQLRREIPYESHLFAQLYIDIMGLQNLEYDLQWEQIEEARKEFHRESLDYTYEVIGHWIHRRIMQDTLFVAVNKTNEVVASGKGREFGKKLESYFKESAFEYEVDDQKLMLIKMAGAKGKVIYSVRAWAIQTDDNG
jgi:hypothetical protein